MASVEQNLKGKSTKTVCLITSHKINPKELDS